jgi:hypothetical protein
MEPCISPYFIDTNAWGMVARQHDLTFIRRMGFTTRHRDAQGSWDMIVESMSRHGYGFHDPRGIVATPGA